MIALRVMHVYMSLMRVVTRLHTFNGSEWPTCMNTSVCTQSGSDVYTTSVGPEWLMHACICVESGSHVCIHSVGQNDVARMY